MLDPIKMCKRFNALFFLRLKMISDRCNEYVIVHFYNVCNISFSTNNRVLTIDLLNRRRSICKVLLRLSSMNLLGFHMKIYVRCMFLFEDHPLLELTFSTDVTANLN